MINWFNMPEEGLSNGGQFEIKELTATENKTYQKDGEVYNKVTVNVSGGSSDFTTAAVSIDATDVEILGVVANSIIYFPDVNGGYGTSLHLPVNGGNVLLYQNEGIMHSFIAIDTNEQPLENAAFTFSGDAEWDAENEELIVSGDFTIHISSGK